MDYFKDLYSDCEWIAVQEKSSRSVYRLARNGQPWAYIKIYHPVDLGQKISNRLRPRTASEAHILKDLKAAGFRVPDVIAHHTTGHKSALVTEAIVPGTPLHDIEKSDQREIMLQLATELLKAGYLHRDLHWGNVILDHEQRAYLIDAYEIQKKTIKQKDIIEMFGQVLSIYSVSDRQLKAALKELGHKDLIPAIRRRSHEIARRRSLDMVERCIKPSSFTREISSDEYTALIYQQQEIDLDQTIRRHHQNLKNDENVLKVQDKTQLSIVDSFCVKSYRKPKPATEPYALRAWKGLLSLHFNGIRTAQPVAMLIFNDKSSILINEAVPHPGFDRVLFHDLKTMDVRDRHQLIGEYGRIIGAMHARGIYHADLKACNVLVDAKKREFFLVDTDRVNLYNEVSREKRIKNLVQINNSIPRDIPRSTRMLFMKNYCNMTGDEPKALFRDVWLSSRMKEILFTTNDGDRRAAWEES